MLPVHLHLRFALECTSVEAAIAKIESLGGSSSSQHILIADTHGGRSLEVSPRGAVYLKEDANGIIVHTNHFIQNKLVDEPPWLTGSPIRLDRARDLTAELAKQLNAKHSLQKLSPALLRHKVFADTFNSPQAICCSPDPDRAESVETLFNIVMVFEQGKPPTAEVLFGRPASDGHPVHYMPW